MPKQTDSASKKAIKSQQLSIVHLVYCRNINKNVHKECIFVSGISSYTLLCQIQIRRDSFFFHQTTMTTGFGFLMFIYLVRRVLATVER